jgi:methylmalonyl-CoA mutase
MQQTDATTSLFGEFSSSTAADWKARIIKDLKGADFSSLVWSTEDGLDIQPYYTREDLPALAAAMATVHEPATWQNREYIQAGTPAQVQQQLQHALQKGADAAQLDLRAVNWQAADIAKALQGTALNQSPVSFLVNSTEAIQEYIQHYHPAVSALKGSIAFDPLAQWMTEDTDLEKGFDALFALNEQLQAARNFNAITIGGHHFHNSGAGIVQELAFTLASAVAYLDALTKRGAGAEQLCQNVEFSVSVGTNYFFEIARLRALRWLWLKITASYGVPNAVVRIHAVTSQWSLTAADPYVNMLRHTTEAMAALTGGCTALTVLPYNLASGQATDEFASRIARNVSTILKEEAYFDKTANAADGSYYLENLTEALTEAAWALFLQVEEKGGIEKAFTSGWVQGEITRVREQKLESLRNGSNVLVGTNKYTLAGEVPHPEPVQVDKATRHLPQYPAYRYL